MIIRNLFLLLAVFTVCSNLSAQLCQGSLGDPIINITFGNGPNPGPRLTNFTKKLEYVSYDCPNDGSYTIRSNTSQCFGNTWHSLTADHTGDGNGYFMLINASIEESEFYRDTVKGLCPSTTYEFAAWIMNVILPSACMGNNIAPNLTFNIETPAGVILNTYSTNDIGSSSTPVWKQYGFFFTTPPLGSDVVLRISNNSKGGCGNDLAIDDITFRPCGAQLTPAFADGTQGFMKDLCVGVNTDVTFTCNVSQGYTNPKYQWQQSTDNGATWTDLPDAQSNTLMKNFSQSTPIGEYIYRLTVVEQSNYSITSCRIASETLTVRISPHPVTSAINTGPVCDGNKVDLSASGGVKYDWSGVNGFSASGSPVTISGAGNADAGKYYVTITSSTGCVDVDSTTLFVNPKPVASTNFTQATICSGDSVTLSSSEGISYSWFPAIGLSDPNISDPVAKPTDTTRYKVEVANQFSCKDSAFVAVNVVSAPKADAGPDQVILEGQSVQLQAVVSGNISALLWSPSANINNPQTLQPIVNPVVDTRYILNVTSDNGCGTDQDSVLVRVYKKVIVPNAFSPNSDGINDTWNITALNTYSDYDLLVFNRYGQVVFKTKNYFNTWRGTYNGKPLPVGTYYYFIDLKNNLPKLNGSVTILR